MLLLSLILAAGGLDDAKAALKKLDAPQPVHGELKVMRWQRVTGGDKPNEMTGGITFHVSDSASGVAMQCAPGMLNEKSGGIVSTTTLLRVHKLLDAKAELLKQLEHADGVVEEPAKWKDQDARLLKMKVAPEDFAKAGKAGVSIDASNMVASLWVAEDGTPLASEFQGDVEAGVLMLKMKNHTRVTREYAVANGRLVVVRESEETDTDAVGHGIQVRQTTELKVEPGS